MLPSWTFDRLLTRNQTLQRPQYVNLQSQRHRAPRPHALSKCASVGDPELQYSRCHLLGLPIEIRHILWEVITARIIEKSSMPYFQRPRDEYQGLLLSSRQIYKEVQPFWCRYIVPWSRVRTFLDTQLNRTNIRRYRSLSIELRLDRDPRIFCGLAAVLHKSQPHLRELRLFFVGYDEYGRKIYTHGCGNLDTETVNLKLPIDGQLRTELLPLWKRIATLGRLEVLVISNPNFQIFEPMVLINKPVLEYLHLPTDPRSTIHKQHDVKDLGFLLTAIPPKDHYPPVKVLHIAANATLSSNALAAKVAETLEHLTWVVPDSAIQSGGMNGRWYERSAELLLALAMKGAKLQTLRICISGAGIYEDPQYGVLLGNLKCHLPYLKALQHLELHAKSKSYWFGKEIIAQLPDSLENLYVTDRTVHPMDLLQQVWDRYLAAANKITPGHGSAHQEFACLEMVHDPEQLDGGMGQLPFSEDKGPWYITAGPYPRYHLQDCHPDDAVQRLKREQLCRSKSIPDQIPYAGYSGDCRHILAYDEFDPHTQMIGESLGRHDYIPFHTGRLRFVHYEYDAENTLGQDEMIPVSLIATLLINGRLLDKERNRHLAKYDRGQPIPPNYTTQNASEKNSVESATRSNHMSYSFLLHELYGVESVLPRVVQPHLEELEQSLEVKGPMRYFGLEQEAADVFKHETVAEIGELLPYWYPVRNIDRIDGRCHWMSPDAVVPGMTDRERTRSCSQ